MFGALRQEADAARLQARYGAAFAPLIFDVTDGAAVLRAAAATTLGALAIAIALGLAGTWRAPTEKPGRRLREL